MTILWFLTCTIIHWICSRTYYICKLQNNVANSISTKLENIVLRLYTPYVILLNVYRTAIRSSSNFKHLYWGYRNIDVALCDVIRGKNCWHCGIANCLYWCRDDSYDM